MIPMTNVQKALNKEKPAKPKYSKTIDRNFCTVCYAIVCEKFNYCSRCGQRIDWGNNNR